MLEFEVKGQKIKRTDRTEPATDSINYLKAKFNFDADWNGKTKTAYFKREDAVYSVLVGSDNSCIVPAEVLVRSESRYARTQGNTVYVTIVGKYNTTVITTNEEKITLNLSGYGEAEKPSEPTPDLHQQLLTAYSDTQAKYDETQQSLTLYSNALKGNVSGTTVSADDVSPIEHELNVCVHGKNRFFSNVDAEGRLSGIDYSIAKDTSVLTLNGIATMENALVLPDSFILEAGTYTASVIGSNKHDSGGNDRIFLRDIETNEVIINHITVTTPRTFILHNKTIIRSYFVFKQGSIYDNTTIQIQIEKGDTVTDYEDWIVPTGKVVKANSVEYTATQNGTVEGIKSTALANGISTEAEGMTIDVEYNKDINKTVNKLTNAIIALGGTI